MFRCLVEDQCPACGCNSLRGAINAEAVGNSVADRVEGDERTGLSSTKPATNSVRHRDKLDLFSYGKQKLIFILFLDCFSLSLPPSPLFLFVSFIVLFRSQTFPSISIAPLCSDVLQLSFSFPLFLAASNLGIYFERRSYLRNRVLSFSLLASVSVRS